MGDGTYAHIVPRFLFLEDNTLSMLGLGVERVVSDELALMAEWSPNLGGANTRNSRGRLTDASVWGVAARWTPKGDDEWQVDLGLTNGKGQSATQNAKVASAITGHIVDPASLGLKSSRIPVCSGTQVDIVVTDTTGDPTVTANSGGISCAGSTCTVMTIGATEKYIASSSDGKDTDRMTLLPK